MRRELLLIVSFILLIGSSCHRHTAYPSAMLQAVELMDVQPDSALKLLHTVDSVIHNYNEETQRYHQLLTIQAEDKCDVFHESDSLVNTLISYYENHYDTHKLALAYYYKGRINADLGVRETAIVSFNQAILYCKQDSDYSLLGLCYSQLSDCYIASGLYNEAITGLGQSLSNYEVAHDTIRFPYTLRNMARCYSLKYQIDSARYYYEASLMYAQYLSDDIRYGNIIGEYGCFLYDIGEKEASYPVLLQAKCYNVYRGNVYGCLAKYHKEQHRLDSANYYIDYAFRSGDLKATAIANTVRYAMAKEAGNYELAHSYYMDVNGIMDSIRESRNTAQIARLNRALEHEGELKQTTSLEKQNLLKIMVLLVTAFLLMTVCVVLYRNKKKLSTLLHLSTRREQEHLLQIADAKNELQRMTVKLEALERQRVQMHGISNIMETTIYKELFTKKDLTDYKADWVAWDRAVCAFLPSLYPVLKQLYPSISPEELRICSLVRLGMPNQRLAKLFFITHNGMTNRRTRLLAKLDKEKTTSKLSSFLERIV